MSNENDLEDLLRRNFENAFKNPKCEAFEVAISDVYIALTLRSDPEPSGWEIFASTKAGLPVRKPLSVEDKLERICKRLGGDTLIYRDEKSCAIIVRKRRPERKDFLPERERVD